MTFAASIPGPPIAQGRPRYAVVHGKARAFSPKRSRDWKAYAVGMLQTRIPAASSPLFERGTSVDVTIYAIFPRPKSWPKTKRLERQPAPKKPDVDNLAKAVLDACTTAGVWHDDAQVVRLDIIKLYAAKGEPPGVVVLAQEFDFTHYATMGHAQGDDYGNTTEQDDATA